MYVYENSKFLIKNLDKIIKRANKLLSCYPETHKPVANLPGKHNENKPRASFFIVHSSQLAAHFKSLP